MTYLHALQYLSDDAREAADTTDEMPRSTARKESNPLYDEYCAQVRKEPGNVCYLLFDADAFGLLCAAYCRAALMAAGWIVGEIADSTVGDLSKVLCINGTPLSPAHLREACHTARAAEQKILRRAAKTAATGDSTIPTTSRLSAAQRCGAVLPRLFAEAGCRVILLIGSIRDARLRHMAQNAAGSAVAVLSAAANRPLQHFPTGTREVVCPTCPASVFSKVTDACSRSGSRLTLTTTSHLTRHEAFPFSQKFSYRSLSGCTLRCGTAEALRAAMLATEAMLALGRLGCSISEGAIQRGLATVSEKHFFAPLSIKPLLITHAVHGEDDALSLVQALREFKEALPQNLLFLCEDPFPDAWASTLAAYGKVAPLTPQSAIEAYQGEDERATVLVGRRDTLEALAATLGESIRRL
jgi:hypothetical protein